MSIDNVRKFLKTQGIDDALFIIAVDAKGNAKLFNTSNSVRRVHIKVNKETQKLESIQPIESSTDYSQDTTNNKADPSNTPPPNEEEAYQVYYGWGPFRQGGGD